MKVREVIEKLMEVDPEAVVLTPRDGFSLEVEMIEPIIGGQLFCEVAPGHWQRCFAESCDRNRIAGVLLI